MNEYVQDDFLVDDDDPIIYETQTVDTPAELDAQTTDTPTMYETQTADSHADLSVQTSNPETPSSRSSTATLQLTPPRRRSLRQRERNQRRISEQEADQRLQNCSIHSKRRRVIDSDEEDLILDSDSGNEGELVSSSFDTIPVPLEICADSYQDVHNHSHDAGMHLLFQYSPSLREPIIPETPQRERRSRGESERVICRRMSRLV